MKECHVCLYMCADDDEICPLCGAELRERAAIDENPQDEIPESGEKEIINNPVLAASADSPVTAEIFKDILAENGIAYSADEQGDIMHSGFGGSYFTINIYVDEKNVDMAKELYRNLTENESALFDFEDEDGE